MATFELRVICCLTMYSVDVSLSFVNGLPMIDFTEENKEVPASGLRISGTTKQCYSTVPTFTWDLVMKNGSGSTSLSTLYGSSVSSISGGSCSGGNSLYAGSVSVSYGIVNPVVFGKTVNIQLTINNNPSVSTISTGSLYFKVYYNLTGSSQLAALGQEFVWTCNMTLSAGQTIYAVKFYREETQVGVLGVFGAIPECQMTVSDSRYRFHCVSETEYNLIIPAENLTEYEQNSLWRCSYFSGQSAYSSVQERLLIAIDVYNITLEPSDNPLIMTEGSQRQLRCTVNSNAFPSPMFSWFLDGTYITNSTGSATSSIVLTGRRRENGKTARCDGTNNNKTKSQSVVLDIQYKPEVNASPQSIYTVTEGRTAVMTCTVSTANPSSGITWTWKKADTPDVILHRTNVYTIPNIQRQQAGTYMCTATNSVGKSTPGLVDVLVLFAPQINEALVHGGPVVNESSPFTFFCSVSSSSATDISIMNLDTSEIVTSVFNTTLLNHTEESAKCFHTAAYICIAQNAVGESKSSPIQMFVNCEPRSRSGLSYYDVIMDVNGALDLTIALNAYPQPSFAWTFRHTRTGPQVPVSADFKMTVTTLNAGTFSVRLQRDVISRELFGYYTVKAKNEMGFFTTVFYVNPQGEPQAPRNVSVICLTSGSAVVSWLPGFDGGSAQMFVVSYGRQTEKLLNTSTVSEFSVFIPNLLNSETYLFRVIAVNKHGESFSADHNCFVNGKPGGNSDTDTSIPILASLLGIILCVCGGLLAYIFVGNIRKKRGKTCFWKTGQNEDYVMHDVMGADDHHYQGIAAEQETSRQKEQSSQYADVDNSGNKSVYDQVEDINTGEYSNVIG